MCNCGNRGQVPQYYQVPQGAVSPPDNSVQNLLIQQQQAQQASSVIDLQAQMVAAQQRSQQKIYR